jgi:hypothetical protein
MTKAYNCLKPSEVPNLKQPNEIVLTKPCQSYIIPEPPDGFGLKSIIENQWQTKS